jgi:hypothetical protein
LLLQNNALGVYRESLNTRKKKNTVSTSVYVVQDAPRIFFRNEGKEKTYYETDVSETEYLVYLSVVCKLYGSTLGYVDA